MFEHINEFIRKYGDKEPMNKFFMDSSRVTVNGTVLTVITNTFGLAMLNSPRSIETALSVAKELDPSITEVKITCGDGKDVPTTSSVNSDLDTL